jgi:hypothetical protein
MDQLFLICTLNHYNFVAEWMMLRADILIQHSVIYCQRYVMLGSLRESHPRLFRGNEACRMRPMKRRANRN